MSETWEHFHAAARLLVGAGPVKQRLIDAYRQHLASLRDTDLPELVANDFAALTSALHCAQATGGLSAPEVAVRKMSEKDAADHAASIMDMFVTLTPDREPLQARRLRVVGERSYVASDDDEDGVPAFLSRA